MAKPSYKPENLSALKALFFKHLDAFVEANNDVRVDKKWQTGEAMWDWMILQGLVPNLLRIAGDEIHHDHKTKAKGHPLWRFAFRRTLRADARLEHMMVGANSGPRTNGTPLLNDFEGTDAEEDDDENEANLEVVGESPSITEQHAKVAASVLLRHVLDQEDGVMEPLTYLQVARAIGRHNKHGVPWARGMGRVLGKITEWIDALQYAFPEQIPYLTTIVVAGSGTNSGLPGVGIAGKWKGYDTYTRIQKEMMVDKEYDHILNFGSRWETVGELLGLEGFRTPELTPTVQIFRRRGGGESPAHKALKLHVLANPQLVGASSEFDGVAEADLLSGDAIDVLFRSKTQWVGVEVKSRTSDKNWHDYRRGIFQAIKYQAVLEAQAKYENPLNNIEVKVLLVLESSMPLKLKKLVKQHNINVISKVVPPAAVAVTSISVVAM